ncbi:HAD domain-containing protein [Kutzneria sp. CA-103260]|uniref:HAD domain-containing protein n=1 Tax=Kutzneria sp. CA-103260 TaxID=2802641 RepID=UPI001BAD460F|nr:HAD domain-containing protein [Kutzneria sp. CA-103260]QUQ66047.1 HAD domain in Swiss Army Knife RNA repair protein [Kutzneria sp. CA-103260]
MHRPLIFLDVDGTLIPFGGGPYPSHHTDSVNPLLERLDPAHGARLSALPGDLVWATTWLSEANELITPVLGLRPLPIVAWPDSDDEETPGLHWKTRHLVAYAAGRPFAWVDDEIGAVDRAWVVAHHGGDALLHKVNPRVGLVAADYAALAEWGRRTRMAD